MALKCPGVPSYGTCGVLLPLNQLEEREECEGLTIGAIRIKGFYILHVQSHWEIIESMFTYVPETTMGESTTFYTTLTKFLRKPIRSL